MSFLSNMSIKGKVVFITLLVSTLSLLLAGCAFVLHDRMAFRERMVVDMTITADITAANSTAAIAFDDSTTAEEVLKGLAANPDVLSATLWREDKSVFAQWKRKASTNAPEFAADGAVFSHRGLVVHRPVTLDGGRVGTVAVQASLSQLTARMQRITGTIGVILLACMVAAFCPGGCRASPHSFLAAVTWRVSTEGDARCAWRHGGRRSGRTHRGFQPHAAGHLAADGN